MDGLSSEDRQLLEIASKHPDFYGTLSFFTERGLTKYARLDMTLKSPMPKIWRAFLRALLKDMET